MHRSCGELSENVTASTDEVVEVFAVLTHHCSCGQRIPPLFAALHGTSPRLRDAEGAVQSECLFDAWGLHIIHLKTESRSSSGAVVHWMGSGSVVISHRYYLGARNNSTFSTVVVAAVLLVLSSFAWMGRMPVSKPITSVHSRV